MLPFIYLRKQKNLVFRCFRSYRKRTMAWIRLKSRFERVWRKTIIWNKYSVMGQVKFMLRQTISLQIFLKAVFHKFYLIRSWILPLIYSFLDSVTVKLILNTVKASKTWVQNYSKIIHTEFLFNPARTLVTRIW